MSSRSTAQPACAYWAALTPRMDTRSDAEPTKCARTRERGGGGEGEAHVRARQARYQASGSSEERGFPGPRPSQQIIRFTGRGAGDGHHNRTAGQTEKRAAPAGAVMAGP